MKVVYLLHGFNVGDSGKHTTDQFLWVLAKEGYKHIRTRRDILDPDGRYVIDLDYGWTGLAGVRICDKKLGSWLAEMVIPGSSVIAHSNGCAIASYAAEYGAPFDGMVFINPALNREWKPPRKDQWMDVYYNNRDFWTLVAAILPGHRWGAMGHFGPDYNDPQVTAYDTIAEYKTKGHSGVFKSKAFNYWGFTIVQRALSHDQET